jgi:hypothetical protein
MSEVQTGPANPASAPRRRTLLKAGVSLWLAYHFLSIIVAAGSVSPASSSVRAAWYFACRYYLQGLYLNHGYRFFAPQPAESTLLAWTVERANGTESQGRIPHRDIQPRLLYHRHFMLTEFLTFVPPDLEQTWHASYARHLCRELDGVQVHLGQQTHYLPTMQAVREGVTLTAAEGYAEEPLGTFRCADFSD